MQAVWKQKGGDSAQERHFRKSQTFSHRLFSEFSGDQGRFPGPLAEPHDPLAARGAMQKRKEESAALGCPVWLGFRLCFDGDNLSYKYGYFQAH